MLYKRLVRKRDNLKHKIYSERLQFMWTKVGLKAISHLIPHFGKLNMFEYVR